MLKALIALALCAALATNSYAEDLERRYNFRIKAETLGAALDAIVRQTEMNVLYPYALADTPGLRPVIGQYTIREALDIMFCGTIFSGGLAESGVVTISLKDNTDGENVMRKRGLKNWLLSGVSALFVGAGCNAAVAQDGGATDSASSGGVIDSIVVTAQKRGEQNLNDIAMSISAIGADEIDQRGLVGLSDILNSLPSVSILDQGPGFNSVVVRGIAADPQRDGLDSGPITGVYFGETPIAGLGIQGNSADLKLVDIERIEVLRGPQGTLYGAGAMGGVVRNIPIAPNLEEFEGNVAAGYSHTGEAGDDNTFVQGVVNIPIVEDKLALRVVGYHYDNSGYYNNIAASDPDTVEGVALFGAVALNQENVGSSTYTGGRVSLLWSPTSDLEVTLSHATQEIEQDGWAQSDIGIGNDVYAQRRFQLRSADAPAPGFGEPVFNEGLDDDFNLSNLLVEYDLGWGSLTSSTSHVEQDSSFRRNPDFFGFQPSSQPIDYSGEAFVQEVRVNSDFEGPFQFLAGAYYEDRETGFGNTLLFGGSDALNPFSQILLVKNGIDRSVEQLAFFGEVSYDIIEDLTLTLGGRYYDYERSVVTEFFDSEFVVDSRTEIDNSEDGTNFKAALEYRANDDALLYASWSEGFRLGYPVPAQTLPVCDQDNDGFYDGSNGLTTGPRTIESDTVENYEIGGKFGLMGGKVQVNASVYRTDWSGIPITQLFDFCNAVDNAGEARTQGLELETVVQVTDDFSFDISGSYLNSELTTDAPGLGASKGDRLPGAPEYNVSFGAQYLYQFFDYDAYIRADYDYVGGFFNNLQETGTEAGDYGLFGISAGIQIDNVNLAVFGQNLTNEDAITWIDAEVANFEHGNRLRPRTIGVRARASF